MAVDSLGGCHAVLKGLIEGGAQLDAGMVQLYQQLHRAVGGGGR